MVEPILSENSYNDRTHFYMNILSRTAKRFELDRKLYRMY
ncbi:hypothetical protein SAMN05444362_10180 [Dysgonomonas macrotermitis]|uniref:Uncharacterized protein n=1 Tax=Dysgonomonas macrotermitis TaxID=1346286 RepID=A0A1M4SJA1_9BACT|nr:hypothetical protein SAMN05444362_10180 [Dysgonomonas macrotermitis]